MPACPDAAAVVGASLEAPLARFWAAVVVDDHVPHDDEELERLRSIGIDNPSTITRRRTQEPNAIG